jgi:SOS-response transcriptional repressor LexA
MNARQRRLFEFINEFWMEFLRAPTLREIIEHTDITSTSVAAKNLNDLYERGLLLRLIKPKGAATPYLPIWVHRALQRAARAEQPETPRKSGLYGDASKAGS